MAIFSKRRQAMHARRAWISYGNSNSNLSEGRNQMFHFIHKNRRRVFPAQVPGFAVFICTRLFRHSEGTRSRSISLPRARLVRGTPTAGVLIHWVIISKRWERIQQRDSESPINTDSPRKEKCCDAFPGREITGPKNTQN